MRVWGKYACLIFGDQLSGAKEIMTMVSGAKETMAAVLLKTVTLRKYDPAREAHDTGRDGGFISVIFWR